MIQNMQNHILLNYISHIEILSLVRPPANV
jgi:hypothetical protein